MQLDPRWSVFLSLGLAALAFLGGASGLLVDTGLDPTTVKHLLAWDGIALGLGNCVNAVLGAIPSKPGPEAAKSFYLGPKVP
jgi:hypothetical protein